MIFCGWNLHLIGFVSQLGRLAVELRLVSQSFKKRKKSLSPPCDLGSWLCTDFTVIYAARSHNREQKNNFWRPFKTEIQAPTVAHCARPICFVPTYLPSQGEPLGATLGPSLLPFFFYHRLLSPAWPWCLPCALHAKLSLCIPLDNREPHLCYICSSQPWAMTPLYSWSALVYICVSLPPFFSFPFTQTERCVWVWPGRADVSLPPPRDTSTAFIFLGWNVRTNTQVGLMASRFVARRLLKRRSGATAGALTDRIQHATQTCLFQHMSNQIRDDEFIPFNTGGRRASGENTR